MHWACMPCFRKGQRSASQHAQHSRPPGPTTAVQVAALVRECMEGAASLRVPLRVKLHSGPSWGELTELQL